MSVLDKPGYLVTLSELAALFKVIKSKEVEEEGKLLEVLLTTCITSQKKK